MGQKRSEAPKCRPPELPIVINGVQILKPEGALETVPEEPPEALVEALAAILRRLVEERPELFSLDGELYESPECASGPTAPVQLRSGYTCRVRQRSSTSARGRHRKRSSST